MSYAETVRNIAATCENYAQLDPVPPVALTFVAHGFTAIAEALERLLPVEMDAGECDGDCNEGEAAESLEADRDELSATVERLYDGIDAAIAALAIDPDFSPASAAAFRAVEAERILRDLRPSVPAPTNAEIADEIDDDGHVREVNL